MDIEINRGTVTDTAATHIRLICDYQSSRNGIYGSGRLFIMIPDSVMTVATSSGGIPILSRIRKAS